MTDKRQLSTEISRLCLRAIPWTLPVCLLGSFLGLFFWRFGYFNYQAGDPLSGVDIADRLLADVFIPGLAVADWLSFDTYTTKALDWMAFAVAQFVYYYVWTLVVLFWRWWPSKET